MRRRRGRFSILLLLVVSFLVDLVVAYVLVPRRPLRLDYPEPFVLGAEALACSQVSLAGLWLALGVRPVPAAGRLLGVWFVVAFWSRMLRVVVPLSDWHITSTSLAVTFVIQAAAITAALLVLRWAGFALADDLSEVRPQDAGPLSFQFSLQSLLGVVAAVAFCLATSSMVVRYTFLLELPEAFLLPMGTRGVGHAVLGLAAAWAVLGTRRAALRTSALGLAVLAAVALQAVTARTALLAGGMSRGWHELALATLAELVFVLIGMGAIRLSGLRLVRTSPAR